MIHASGDWKAARLLAVLVVLAVLLSLAACGTFEALVFGTGGGAGQTEFAAGAPAQGRWGAGGSSGDPREALPARPCETRLTAAEQRLYDLIMEYRKPRGLPRIPLSPSLSYVAKVHVRDLQENPPRGSCNLHSWSNKGPWTACCYTDDHAQAKCMWNKPRELTDYPGNGYEISYTHSAAATPEEALVSWKGSSGHNAVIINDGVWARHPWGAIGIGIYGNYAVVWFGEEADPCAR